MAAMAWPAEEPDGHSGLSGSEWRVTEVLGSPVAGAGTARFTQTSVRGRAACNVYFASFRENGGGVIEIAGINETRRVCEGRMELERGYLQALERAKSYRVESGTIVLMDAGGKPLVRLSS
jgi:putative lipoprotein